MKNDQRWGHDGRRSEPRFERGRNSDYDYDDYNREYRGSKGRRSSRDSSRAPGWEQNVIEKIATESLKEQRRARRWSVFFKALGFAYVAVALLIASRNGAFNLSLSTPENHIK